MSALLATPDTARPLVLGSTSRYRRELLSRLRLAVDVAAPDVDETPLQGEAPRALALRLLSLTQVVGGVLEETSDMDAAELNTLLAGAH